MEENENGKLLIDSVQLRFGDKVVLQSAYVTSYKGRVTGVLGRNGTGKSCLFKCIMGGIRPQNKYIRLNDEPRTDYGHIGLRVKYLPQAHFIPPGMTLPQAYELYGVDYEGLVQFDEDGNITVNGKPVKKILVNGKEYNSGDPYNIYVSRIVEEVKGEVPNGHNRVTTVTVNENGQVTITNKDEKAPANTSDK